MGMKRGRVQSAPQSGCVTRRPKRRAMMGIAACMSTTTTSAFVSPLLHSQGPTSPAYSSLWYTANLDRLLTTPSDHDCVGIPDLQDRTAARRRNPAARWSVWKRRLVTREDWKHVHKITGVSFLLSSAGLAGYGIRDLWDHGWTRSVVQHGPPFFGLLCLVLVSSVVQSFSSVRLACRHRRGQPAVRNTFLCNAAVAILGTVSALWSSPWFPASGDNLVRLPALIASRQQTGSAAAGGGLHYWKDVFVYTMPILIGAPFFVAIGWQFGIRHDRTFYLALLESNLYPHLQAGAVYGMVMVAMGASYSSLIVTLRDKKLISKRTEGLSLMTIMVFLIGSLYQALRDPGAIAALMGM